MKIRISVVAHKNEKLFKLGKVMFDTLHAHDEFEGGELSVVRDRKIFDKTERIHEVGTHAACTCFCGLKKLLGGRNSFLGVSELVPENFRVGDILILDVFVPSSFDFINFLRGFACLYGATLQVFHEKSEMSLGELRERVAKKVATTAKEFSGATIIRFRGSV